MPETDSDGLLEEHTHKPGVAVHAERRPEVGRRRGTRRAHGPHAPAAASFRCLSAGAEETVAPMRDSIATRQRVGEEQRKIREKREYREEREKRDTP